ncbi:putative biotin apo-protein ligase [Pseudovirgaria hyperparasitica]|uniref:Putative biotin apo-protein ligase n=1 Tax=Pseudovirgaria hyperparasitica TaxID=470096 RepID=A0A6A6WHE5_9PEZI|nr:putative biotin apo-protein ligase [Pseudovirgaria hyperparasitica]KAF2761416.1 putative biotin apo-protein ligase [Pseudovirgaria hyperparasitica]
MVASRRLNVLVYSGHGATKESIRHCLYTLRRLLSPNYAVIPVDGNIILKEPWSATCALLVFPGGADTGYCRTLNGDGNRKITQFVNRGGNFIGFCAGGYYGSNRCEFEVGDKKMEVVGDRELGFFPGACRGLAFPGFVYNSEAGARAVELKANKDAFPTSIGLEAPFRVYYNGGGVFVDAEKLKSRGVEVLASFTEDLNVDSGEGSAAVVYRRIGEGHVILTGPHPEFAGINLSKEGAEDNYKQVVDTVIANEKPRTTFMKACLRKLGMQVNEEEQPVPSLSRLHLSAHRPSDVGELVSSWEEVITIDDGEEYVEGGHETFHLEKRSSWSMKTLKDTVASSISGATTESPAKPTEAPAMIDYDKALKKVFPHEDELPSYKETPSFNHSAYFAHLQAYRLKAEEKDGEFGKYLLYGEVVTSTQTMLEKNNALLKHLPDGFTATATTQITGRGRGTNVWVAPRGGLMFSTVMRHPVALTVSAPVVFIQYLAALAIVTAIKSYEPSYSKLPVKLKWPNDIYALDPDLDKNAEGGGYVKIGGLLINTSYSGSDFTLVLGIGLNVANGLPTTSLDKLAHAQGLRSFQIEKILAKILVCLEDIYRKFRRTGWNSELEDIYCKNWLHTDQVVTLETEGGMRARIRGITRDWGLLVAEELGWEDRPTGKIVQLQSDSNSFDFFKGLLKKKL